MIRILLRSVAINIACVWIVVQILAGMITYVGGFKTLLLAAVCISLINLFIRPIVNLLLLPLNLVTLGIFRWVVNLLTLYLVTRFVPSFQINPSDFGGLNAGLLIVPPLHFSAFSAFIVSTLVLTVIFHIVYWLFQD